MDSKFSRYVERLHPSFESLTKMQPVKIPALPKDVPLKCIYLFSENGRHLYVGRTNSLKKRLKQHSNPSSQHNQAVFAFRLAREATGYLEAAYTGSKRRAILVAENEEFAAAFMQAKDRVRAMDVRYVEESDQLRQALLEIYVAVVLETPYNDFGTH